MYFSFLFRGLSGMLCMAAFKMMTSLVYRLQGIQRLTKLIFQRAQPKRLGTQIVSGSMLAALALAYVDAINLGAVPTIATAWQVSAPPSSGRSGFPEQFLTSSLPVHTEPKHDTCSFSGCGRS